MNGEAHGSLHRHSHRHRELARRYRHYMSQREFRWSVGYAALLFVLSFAINTFAINFATERASNAVTDIVLSNVPVFNVDDLFVYGTFFGVFVIAILGLSHPKRLPFILYTAALFFLVRSLFISMTHLGPFEPHTSTDFGVTINRMFFGADLFFSGHTGLPFLGALAFWREARVRWFFLLLSVFFAIVVLLGHLHYTIDVASAYFITFGVFHMAKHLFPREEALFYSEVPDDFE